MTKEIFIIGAGTYGEVMCELAHILGYRVVGFYDEDETKAKTRVMDIDVLGKFSELKDYNLTNKGFIVAIGNNDIRCSIMTKINKLGGITPTLLHPDAIISPSAEIGKGVYIHANTCVWTKVKVCDYSILSPNVVIAHHSLIGQGCLISTSASVGASVIIEDRVLIGMGGTIVTGVSIVGENSVIGAGAVVIKDTDRNSVYAGVPAKKIRDLL